MCKINSIVFIFILSFSYCYNEEYISMRREFNHKIQQIKDHFERIFDQMNNELTKVKEQNWNDLNTCGKDWISYSDRKCYKVFKDKASIGKAKENCGGIDSSLITIESEEEQLFLANILEKYNNISDNVWIGLEMNENSYEWLDGNELKYENWDENSDKNEKCVEMSLGKSSLGKWRDDSCYKKYLIVCQKKQITKTVFKEELKYLTKVIEIQESEIKKLKDVNKNREKITQMGFTDTNLKLLTKIIAVHLKTDFTQELSKQKNLFIELQNQIKTQEKEINNQKFYFTQELSKQQNQINSLIPIGFLYTQLPKQSSPQELWPNTQWTEVTSEYSGLFFRAEGPESAPFGQTQQANQSGISHILFRGCSYSSWAIQECNKERFKSLDQQTWVDVSPGSYTPQYLHFYTTGGEVRPKNTAVKIFKRIR